MFVALNAPFDWMFINDYFHRYLGANPFGHSALDIKAYYMGLSGVTWSETSMKHISAHFLEEKHLTAQCSAGRAGPGRDLPADPARKPDERRKPVRFIQGEIQTFPTTIQPIRTYQGG